MRRKLTERNADRPPSAEVIDAAVHLSDAVGQWRNQIVEIGDVQQVTDLSAFPSMADIGERSAIDMPRQPERDHALIDLAHLPGAGEDAAAQDSGTKAVSGAILVDELLGGEFRRSVDRTRPRRAEAFGNAALGPTVPCRPGFDLEAFTGADERQVQ